VTILTENNHSFFFSTQASLVDTDRDMASQWASAHIVSNPAIKWITGKYVEADNANSNGQYWSLEDLRLSQATILHSPMNISHRANNIVGTFVASEMMYPAQGEANPYIETLGAYWKYYFPDELQYIEDAFAEGSLYQSMECVAESVTCAGPLGCGETFAYTGPMAQNYCEHIKERSSYRQLNNPHFLAGALIYPPDRPGWNQASVKDLSKYVSDETKDAIIRSIASECPHLSAKNWEQMMFAVVEQTFKQS
jgi:hypothetical protein